SAALSRWDGTSTPSDGSPENPWGLSPRGVSDLPSLLRTLAVGASPGGACSSLQHTACVLGIDCTTRAGGSLPAQWRRARISQCDALKRLIGRETYHQD